VVLALVRMVPVAVGTVTRALTLTARLVHPGGAVAGAPERVRRPLIPFVGRGRARPGPGRKARQREPRGAHAGAAQWTPHSDEQKVPRQVTRLTARPSG